MGTPATVERAFGLDKVFQLFGKDIAPVPCETGSKKPAHTYADRSPESFRSHGWLSLFDDPDAQNIAIYLGAASSGLIAIDFDRDEDWEAWDQVNNEISSKTTRSRGGRGCQVWFRIIGTFPASCKTDHFEFRATKNLSTITGIHPSGIPYQLLTDLPAMEITMDDLKWPSDWEVPWIKSPDELAREAFEGRYGPPIMFGKRGGVRINQSSLAAKFRLENDVLFDDTGSQFYLYHAKTGLWKAIPRSVIQHTLEEQYLDLVQEMRAGAESDDDKAKFDDANFAFTSAVQRSIIDLLEGPCNQPNWFKAKIPAIHCSNGMVDLSSGTPKLIPFSKKNYSRHRTEIPFTPGAKCPKFLEQLLLSSICQDDVDLIQRWAGQALLGRNYHQVFLIISGTAGGGKGTLCRVLMDIIGRQRVGQLRTQQLGDRFEIALFRNKSLLYGPDVADNFLNQAGSAMIKALTGNDYMTAEIKGKVDGVELDGDFNVLVTSNSRLFVRLRGDADAWARRMLIVNYDRPKPKEVISDFAGYLVNEEGPGILNWIVDGALKILDDLKHHRKFPITAAQADRVESLLNESDSVRFFVANCVKHSILVSDTITSEDLFTAYCELCNANGWNIENEVRFQKKARDLMIQIHSAGYSKNIGREGKHSIGQRGYTNANLVNLDTVNMPKGLDDDDDFNQETMKFDSETEFEADSVDQDDNENPF